ncbi:HTTM domain-containing protein [Archangium lansingense]|uniref:HTTM domain-containing protein n=1 Tax=Archangium lansingense TaxID=2995310 RepID=UPI003B7628FF
MRSLKALLLAPTDIAPLVWFRLVFGVTMVVEVFRYLSRGWVKSYYIEPAFFFSYYGFDWVNPWPGNWMYVHFAALGVLGAMLALGLLYRVAAPLFWLGVTYVFLLDQTQYLNHMYLVCLLAFLLIWLPGGQAFALDARLGLARPRDTAPAWMLWLLRAQVGLVYFFGGIAKLESDWLSGVPGAMFLQGWTLTEPLAEIEWAARAFAFSGAAFDLFVVPGLLWRRSRPWAIGAVLLFHLTNAQLFRIGIFPWLMLAVTPIFFEPSTVRRWLERWVPWLAPKAPSKASRKASSKAAPKTSTALESPRWQEAGLAFFGLWLAIQCLLPLRHWLYPGQVNWTEEGHNFSWHMKLRNKEGRVRFQARDSLTGERWKIDPRSLLSNRQYTKMSTRPDMVLQFAHELARRYEREGRPGVQIHADMHVSLNGRPRQELVDAGVDLAAQPWTWRAASWIVPLRDAPLAFSRAEEEP